MPQRSGDTPCTVASEKQTCERHTAYAALGYDDVFNDGHTIEPDELFWDRIEKGIRECDAFVVIPRFGAVVLGRSRGAICAGAGKESHSRSHRRMQLNTTSRCSFAGTSLRFPMDLSSSGYHGRDRLSATTSPIFPQGILSRYDSQEPRAIHCRSIIVRACSTAMWS